MDWTDYQKITARMSAALYLCAGVIAFAYMLLSGPDAPIQWLPAIVLALLTIPAGYFVYKVPWPHLYPNAFVAVSVASCVQLAAFMTVTGGMDSPAWSIVMFIVVSKAAYYRDEWPAYLVLVMCVGVLLSPLLYDTARPEVLVVRIGVTVVAFVVARWTFKAMQLTLTRLRQEELAGKRLAAEAAVTTLLLAEPSVESAAPKVLSAIGVHMGCTAGALWLTDGGVLRRTASWSRDDAPPGDALPATVERDAPGPVAETWRTGAMQWTADAPVSATRPSDNGHRPDSGAGVCFPIRGAKGVVGVVQMLGGDDLVPQAETEQALGVIGDAFGQFIERKEAERLLAESERLRSQFQAMVSHELRSPLAVIKGSIELARDEARNGPISDLLESLDAMDRQADRMVNLVNNLLDVGQIEAGAFKVNAAPGDLRDAIDEAVATLKRISPVHVRVEMPERLPQLYIDRQRVVQVLENLLINASKFAAPETDILLRVHVQSSDVVVSVTNVGPPIPPERMPFLFQKFSQVHGEDGRRRPGVGLGLVICKGIVEAHGGRIWAESSEATSKTTFSFTLPIATDLPAAAHTP